MKAEVRVNSYRVKGALFNMYFDLVNKECNFLLRVHRDSTGDIDYELRAYDDNYEFTLLDEYIHDLVTCTEYELFQKSLVHEYDVYLVKAGLEYLDKLLSERTESYVPSFQDIVTIEY